MRIIRRGRQVWRHQETYDINYTPIVDSLFNNFDDPSGWKRLIAFCILRTNTENDARDVHVRWTLDGFQYDSLPTSLNHNQLYYVYRIPQPFTSTLKFSTTPINMLINAVIMSNDAHLESEAKTSIGTNPEHKTWLVYEELEFT